MNVFENIPISWAIWYGAWLLGAAGVWWQTKSWAFVATVVSWAGIGSLFGFTVVAMEPIELPVCVTLGALVVAFGSWFDGRREERAGEEVRE